MQQRRMPVHLSLGAYASQVHRGPCPAAFYSWRVAAIQSPTALSGPTTWHTLGSDRRVRSIRSGPNAFRSGARCAVRAASSATCLARRSGAPPACGLPSSQRTPSAPSAETRSVQLAGFTPPAAATSRPSCLSQTRRGTRCLRTSPERALMRVSGAPDERAAEYGVIVVAATAGLLRCPVHGRYHRRCAGCAPGDGDRTPHRATRTVHSVTSRRPIKAAPSSEAPFLAAEATALIPSSSLPKKLDLRRRARFPASLRTHLALTPRPRPPWRSPPPPSPC